MIRHLLHKKGVKIDPKVLENLISSSCDCTVEGSRTSNPDDSIQLPTLDAGNQNTTKIVISSETTERQKRLIQQNWSSIKSDPDFQAATDSDSAIMLEDHIAEVKPGNK